MPKPRFPSLVSGPSFTAAAVALVPVCVLLFLTGFTPYSLVAVGHEGLTVMLAYYAVMLLVWLLAYRMVAPPLARFAERFAARSPRPALSPSLTAACLRDMDIKCPSCAYNWRGLDQPVCPECNAPVRLHVYTDRPSSAKWNGLIFAWLIVTLLSSALTTYSYTVFVVQFLGMSNTMPYATMPTAYWVTVFVAGAVSIFELVTSLVLIIIGLVPKQPDRRERFVRSAFVWLASMSGAWSIAIIVQQSIQVFWVPGW